MPLTAAARPSNEEGKKKRSFLSLRCPSAAERNSWRVAQSQPTNAWLCLFIARRVCVCESHACMGLRRARGGGSLLRTGSYTFLSAMHACRSFPSSSPGCCNIMYLSLTNLPLWFRPVSVSRDAARGLSGPASPQLCAARRKATPLRTNRLFQGQCRMSFIKI